MVLACPANVAEGRKAEGRKSSKSGLGGRCSHSQPFGTRFLPKYTISFTAAFDLDRCTCDPGLHWMAVLRLRGLKGEERPAFLCGRWIRDLFLALVSVDRWRANPCCDSGSVNILIDHPPHPHTPLPQIRSTEPAGATARREHPSHLSPLASASSPVPVPRHHLKKYGADAAPRAVSACLHCELADRDHTPTPASHSFNPNTLLTHNRVAAPASPSRTARTPSWPSSTSFVP